MHRVPIIKVVCTCVGVALDDLVYICTKIARQMDSNGLSKVFDAAETATSAIEEARPLLENAVKLVDEVCLRSRSLCRTRVHTQLTLHYNLAVSQGNHDCAVAFTRVDLAVVRVQWLSSTAICMYTKQCCMLRCFANSQLFPYFGTPCT